MNKKQLVSMWIGIVLIVGLCLGEIRGEEQHDNYWFFAQIFLVASLTIGFVFTFIEKKQGDKNNNNKK